MTIVETLIERVKQTQRAFISKAADEVVETHTHSLEIAHTFSANVQTGE